MERNRKNSSELPPHLADMIGKMVSEKFSAPKINLKLKFLWESFGVTSYSYNAVGYIFFYIYATSARSIVPKIGML